MDDTLHQQMTYEANRKSVGVTYLLWLILGGLGAHRFYTGNIRTGFIQLALGISFVGWLVLVPWLLADILLIPGLVRDRNLDVIHEMTAGGAQDGVGRVSSPQTPMDGRRAKMLEDLRQTGFSRRRLDTSRIDS